MKYFKATILASLFLLIVIAVLPMAVHVQAATAPTASSSTGLIPCNGPDCTINSVMQLINNIINFFFTIVLIPIFVLAIMYLGFGYLTAEGNPSQHAKLKNTAKHLFLGLLLMMCSFLIVKVILSFLGYTDIFHFFS